MKAAILSVGDELLRGATTDTNAPVLAGLLVDRGVEVISISTVGDSREALRDRVREILGRVDLIFITGGLGPTRDDLTRQAVADVLGTDLDLDRASLETIRMRIEKRGRKMAETNRKQALFPRGAEVIENRQGTAPGFLCRPEGVVLVALPGVPHEMEGMAEGAIEMALEGSAPSSGWAGRTLAVTDLPESVVDERLGPLMERGGNPVLGLKVTDGEIRIHIRAEGEGDRDAPTIVDETEEKIRQALGDHVQAPGGAEEVLRTLLRKGWKIATAESCTGGLIADTLTNVPGASEVFAGGTVAYTPQVKVDHLGVRRETLEREGEVSEAVAREMADGACSRFGAQVGIGITGVAGPTPGPPGTSLGQVCVGIRLPGALISRTWTFHGTRRRVKERAAAAALRHLLTRIS